MIQRTLLSIAFAMIALACGSSEPTICSEACDLIEAACMSTETDCARQCAEDLSDCPVQMMAVLDCVFAASQLQCDPDQDQGLAEAPCQEEHDATELCGKDPF